MILFALLGLAYPRGHRHHRSHSHRDENWGLDSEAQEATFQYVVPEIVVGRGSARAFFKGESPRLRIFHEHTVAYLKFFKERGFEASSHGKDVQVKAPLWMEPNKRQFYINSMKEFLQGNAPGGVYAALDKAPGFRKGKELRVQRFVSLAVNGCVRPALNIHDVWRAIEDFATFLQATRGFAVKWSKDDAEYLAYRMFTDIDVTEDMVKQKHLPGMPVYRWW